MCVFCNIVNGEIPSYKLYEDDFVMCFLDISEATIGHTLVIPKKHYQNVFDVDEETLAHMMKAVKVITLLLKEKLNVENVNILNNSGSLAGQTVMHFHIHVIPRYLNDMVSFSFPENEPNFDELEKTFNKLMKK